MDKIEQRKRKIAKQCVRLTDEQLALNALQKLKYKAKYAAKAINEFTAAYNELPDDLKDLIKLKDE